MKRVIGLGGIFFKAKDPKALYEWYRQHLGIESSADGSGAMWRDADHPEVPGCNVWAIFPQDTKYFAPSQSSFMINFRVENMDDLLRAARRRGAGRSQGGSARVRKVCMDYGSGRESCGTVGAAKSSG
jgi:hypothetical protein